MWKKTPLIDRFITSLMFSYFLHYVIEVIWLVDRTLVSKLTIDCILTEES